MACVIYDGGQQAETLDFRSLSLVLFICRAKFSISSCGNIFLANRPTRPCWLLAAG